MANVGERLLAEVQRFQNKTGKNEMLVVMEMAESEKQLCHVQHDPYYGLLVNGKPPSIQWYQNAEEFHLLPQEATVLH